MMMNCEAGPRSGGFPTADLRKRRLQTAAPWFGSIREAYENAGVPSNLGKRRACPP
jgi:hypothetical protein